ncbi:flagellar export chaperone FliS [Bacillus piscicola]|uniref:flagellar export chaperone FliS n=1 Tax=Bacillus piscicola TaxID=1632684 RepID=UPI0030843AF1
MSFQHAQTAYKQNMQQAEKYKGSTPRKQENAWTASTGNTQTTSAQPVSTPGAAGSSQTNAYQQNALQTASPGDLTLLLYNGCLKFIAKADQALAANNIEEKNKYIIRAQDIIRELMVTLKTDSETGENMFQLYDFIHRRLVDANVNNDNKALEEARELVTDFRDTWKEMIKLERKQRLGERDHV